MPIAHLLLYVAGDQHGALAALGHVAVGDVRGQLDLRPRADEEPVSRGAQRRDVAHAGGPPWHTLTRRGARTGGQRKLQCTEMERRWSWGPESATNCTVGIALALRTVTPHEIESVPELNSF